MTLDGWYGNVDSVVALELGAMYSEESKRSVLLFLFDAVSVGSAVQAAVAPT